MYLALVKAGYISRRLNGFLFQIYSNTGKDDWLNTRSIRIIIHADCRHSIRLFRSPTLSMLWLILLALFAALLCWLLFSPVVLEIDTRIPGARVRWISIGRAKVWYENEWWWSVRVPFYRKTMRFSAMKKKQEKSVPSKEVIQKKKKTKHGPRLQKIVRVIKTFRVVEWKLALDTGDYVRNAQLYPLNFMPGAYGNLQVNFRNESYFVLKISNRPWKILYAFLR